MFIELRHRLIVVAQYDDFFQSAGHALDLTVEPGMDQLGEAVLDAVLVADAAKVVAAGLGLMGYGVTFLERVLRRRNQAGPLLPSWR